MRRCFSFFAFMGFACFCAPALAGQAPAPARVRSVDGTPFCRAESAYPDGRRIAFLYGGTAGALSLEIGIPGGRFVPERRYDLELTLQGKASRRLRAQALTEETLSFDFGTSAFWKTGLENSAEISVGSSEKMISFDLPVLRPLFEALRQCAVQKEEGRTLPVVREKKEKEAFPHALRKFLTRAGFSAFAPVSLEKIPKEERAADFVWETGNVFGGLRVLSVPKGASFSEIVGLHLKGLREKCSGAFRATLEKEHITPFARLRPAEVVCADQPDGYSVFVSILFSLASDGSLNVFTHEGLERHKAEITAARDKIRALLSKQAPPEIAPEAEFIEN